MNLTVGALQIGVYFSVALFGVVSMQTYSYFISFPNDRKVLKTFVTLVWLLELIHTAFVTHAIYDLTVLQWGNLEGLINVPFTLKFSIVWSASISFIVQVFFAWRVHILSESRWIISTCCWTLSAFRFAASVVVTVRSVDTPNLLLFDARFQWLITVILAVGSLVDISIAASMSYYLATNRSGINRTDRMLHHLIKFSIESGLLTSILCLTMLTCFLAMPKNFVWLGIFVVLAKSYSNSFLASLNVRSQLQSDSPISLVECSVNVASSGTRSQMRFRDREPPIIIEMTTVSTTCHDDIMESLDNNKIV